MADKGAKRGPEADAMASMIVDELAPLGAIWARKMFGGYGAFTDDTMFGMVDPTGELYFRVNDATRGQYEDAGASKDRGMPYWGVSRETIEDGDALLALAREALDVALAVKKKR